MPGFCLGIVAYLAARVGDRGLELLPDQIRLVDDSDDTLGISGRCGHQPFWLLEVLDPCAFLRVDALWHRERLPVAAVEALGDVAGQLDVLPLVVADRDDVGLVEQDVAGHQHGVREEPGRDELLLL